MKYAKETSVSPEKSREEIEKTLKRWGAEAFAYIEEGNRFMIAFKLKGRYIRKYIPLPTKHSFKTIAKFEQAVRQRWRAALLGIKARLEEIDSGIMTIEEAFLDGIVIYVGEGKSTTVGDYMIPQIENNYLTGKIPPMLPAPGDDK
jgi:hypothetical protein